MIILIFFISLKILRLKDAEACSCALWIYVGPCWSLCKRRGCLISVNTRRLKTCQASHKKCVADAHCSLLGFLHNVSIYNP